MENEARRHSLTMPYFYPHMTRTGHQQQYFMPKPIIRNPNTRLGRFILGWSLVIGGIFGFLPVLGFWMIPLGLLVLSADYPFARRWRRKLQVWIGKWQRRKREKHGRKQDDPPRQLPPPASDS
tara:strand:+ start:11637 stop:12005 length:369 start_codon:yes stop_codon:yes gene_type:complete